MSEVLENGHTVKDHFLSNEMYDHLKRLAQITIPALGTLYFALAQYWQWPNSEQVVGSIMAVDAFLGILLGYSSRKYEQSGAKYDGDMEVYQLEDGRKSYQLSLNDGPEGLDTQKQVVFKVKPIE
jgi:hypothetical protein